MTSIDEFLKPGGFIPVSIETVGILAQEVVRLRAALAAKDAELDLVRKDAAAGWKEVMELTGELAKLRVVLQEACDLLAERTHGSAARSPGHNARVRLESALAPTAGQGEP